MKIIKRGLLGLFLLLLLSGCEWPEKNREEAMPVPPYEISPQLKEKIERIDKLVRRQIRRRNFNGAVLVAERGHILYENAGGFANYRTKDKLNTYSCFQLASVSKMFTAAAILKLVEQGKIGIDDSVKQHLWMFPYPGVTIRNLLNHRSGLPRYMVVSDEFWPRDTMMNNEEMHQLMVEHCPEPYYPPDYRFNYQNSNYAYLALIVERVSGKSFGHFCRDEIFEPLEMYDTRVFHGKDSTEIPNEVLGHIYRRPRALSPYENYINGVVGDKGVYSTIYDLLRFDQGLYDGKLLPDSLVQMAFKPGSPRRKLENYGFGWRMKPFEHDKLVYHFGWWNGFKSAFMRYLNSRRTIIVLTNRDRSLNLPKQIQDILFEDYQPALQGGDTLQLDSNRSRQ